MFRNVLTNMFCRHFIAHTLFMAQSDVADIFIKVMRRRVAIMVSFVGAHRMFIPLAGKYTLTANRFKTATDASNTGKEIDKEKRIISGATPSR